MATFVARNKPDWDELEHLLDHAAKSVKRMTPHQLSRLDILYRRATVHLSQVRTRGSDSDLINYLNQLTARAHSVIYLPPRRYGISQTLDFLANGLPQCIARNWQYHVVSALLLIGGGLIAYFASMHNPMAMYALLPPGDIRQPGSTPEQLLDVLRYGRDEDGGRKFYFMSFLFTHNLKVGLMAIATGALAAIPTVLLMVYNGMILGAFAAMHHRSGIYGEFWAWILPHGVTEIGAIILCGGIGLMLGRAIVCPGEITRTEKFKHAGMEAGITAFGIALMLIFAAIIESFLRQSHLSTEARFTFAGGTALFWIVYIGHGFLRNHRDQRMLRSRSSMN